MTAHLLDATLFFSPTSGGVRRYLLTKHEWLRRRPGLRHTLVVPGAQDAQRGDGVVEFRSPMAVAGYRCPLRLAALRELLCSLRPDLLEAADPYQVGWQVARSAAVLDVPAVAFCHSDLISLTQNRVGRCAAATAAGYLRRLYQNFALVLAPSRVVADRLRDAGIEHVRVLPLGVDAGLFSPTRRDEGLRRRLGLKDATRLLVFAGRLAPEKNLPHLFEMIDRLGDPYHLVVIGGERTRRISPRTTLLRYEPEPTAVAGTLAAADVLVHAGTQETFGLIALEAMACGVPVVCYEGGALAEIVSPSVGALAASGRPSSLADAVVDLFSRDPRRCGAAARERVLEHYSWDAVFTRQLRLYGSLLGRRLAGASPAWSTVRVRP